jgi:2-polyprenyl-6-hydroxyphenyl methylase/3-demethylubiquinone-9 3-methyltransferase
VLGRFLEANRRASRYLEAHLPQARVNTQRIYQETVAEYMNARPRQVVVDVGGGKRCSFAHHRVPELGTKIVAVDVSAEELAVNTDVDEKHVADVTDGLPVGDEEADLVVSHSVLEHLTSVRPFVADTHRVLKPGGYTIHRFPSKLAPFSVANRLLPRDVSRRLLRALIPGSSGRLGFPAHYDSCTDHRMRRLLEEEGFEIVSSRVSYYQSDYFEFALPVYVVSALYEIVISALKLRPLAATVVVVARKSVAG